MTSIIIVLPKVEDGKKMKNLLLRSGYEEVKSYGPSWWPEYREMNAVYKYAGWTLDLMAHFLEKLIWNYHNLDSF